MAKKSAFFFLTGLFLSATVFSQTTIKQPEQKPAADALRPFAIPVRSIDPTDEDFSDLMPLIDKIGSSRVVVLGEATHSEGTSDRAKARMVKFLHAKMGFDVLAWETGFVQTYAMNAALRRPDVSLQQAKLYLMTGGWSMAEGIHPLFEYVRTSWQTARPLEMAGFDKGRPAVAAPYFRKFLTALGARAPLLALGEEEWKLVESFNKRAYGFFGREIPKEDERNRERAVLEKLLDKIRKQRAELLKHLSENELIVAERFVYDALKCEETEYIRLTQGGFAWNKTRDRFMADNFLWLMKTLYPNRKIIVWAATAHLIRNSNLIKNPEHKDWYTENWEMGNHLYPVLGEDLYTIAFTSYGGKSGEIFPSGENTKNMINDRTPAPPNSFEAVAHDLQKPYLFVDLRSPPPEHWLRGDYFSVSLGRFVNTAPWSKVVDAFFFINQSEPVRYMVREK